MSNLSSLKGAYIFYCSGFSYYYMQYNTEMWWWCPDDSKWNVEKWIHLLKENEHTFTSLYRFIRYGKANLFSTRKNWIENVAAECKLKWKCTYCVFLAYDFTATENCIWLFCEMVLKLYSTSWKYKNINFDRFYIVK